MFVFFKAYGDGSFIYYVADNLYHLLMKNQIMSHLLTWF